MARQWFGGWALAIAALVGASSCSDDDTSEAASALSSVTGTTSSASSTSGSGTASGTGGFGGSGASAGAGGIATGGTGGTATGGTGGTATGGTGGTATGGTGGIATGGTGGIATGGTATGGTGGLATGGTGTGGGDNVPGALLWAKRTGGPNADGSRSVAALVDGSSLVTGSFAGTTTLNPGEASAITLTASAAADTDAYLARYDASGTVVWAKRIGGTGNAFDTAIAALADQGSVVLGRFTGSATFAPGEPNETTLVSSLASSDLFIARYDPAGALLWVKSAGGAQVNNAQALALAPDGSTLIGGWYQGDVTFGAGEPGQTTLSSPSLKLFLASFDATGSVAWAKTANAAASYGLAALSDGSWLVTGSIFFNGIFSPGEPGEISVVGAGDYDIYLAKYDASGVVMWVKTAGGPGSDGSILGNTSGGMATLADGTSFVTGRFQGAATFGAGEPAQTVLTSAGGDDAFIARFDPAGALVWAKRVGGTLVDAGTKVAALADGTSFVVGHFGGTVTFGAGEPAETVLTSSGVNDMFIASFDSSGSLLWARRAGGAATDTEAMISASPDGSAMIVGSFTTNATFGPGEPNETILTSAGMGDGFVAKLGLGDAGAGGAGSGGAGTGGAGGGAPSATCDEVSGPAGPGSSCSDATPANCYCVGCTSDGVCDPATDDCTCPDCASDVYCADSANCVNDGICDVFVEGCVCADCATAAPQCGSSAVCEELNGPLGPDGLGCNDATPGNCNCMGCVIDGICDYNTDDCTCADCLSDAFCSDPLYCVDDGLCDVYLEGCVCADCFAVAPECQ